MWRIVTAFCSIPLSYFPCLDSCGCPISRCAIFALMFRAARVAVLLILGFLFWILYVVMLWIIRVFFPMLVFWLWGTLLICGIYGRGVGDVLISFPNQNCIRILCLSHPTHKPHPLKSLVFFLVGAFYKRWSPSLRETTAHPDVLSSVPFQMLVYLPHWK
jgi:hypothetical protein